MVALAGCSTSRTGAPSPSTDRPDESTAETTADATEPSRSEGKCGYAETSGEEAPVGLPPDDDDVEATSVVLTTNSGELPIELRPETAPCTVQSFVFLAEEGFYDDTDCHRLTASAGLKVLQCGDPNGDGTGGPGYTIPDELPTDLPGGSAGPDGQPTATYQRGIVAMANAGPETGGSQFFLVYGDSTLPPAYAVFGTVDAAGLATLDKIAAAGLIPTNSPEDGSPKQPVTIESVTVD